MRADIQKKAIQKKIKTTKQGMFACMSCQNCTSIIKGKVVQHPMKGHNIKIRGYHTCNSHNVVYCLKCPCGKAYVGQTTRQIKVRLNEHRSSISLYHSKVEQEHLKGEGTVHKMTNKK